MRNLTLSLSLFILVIGNASCNDKQKESSVIKIDADAIEKETLKNSENKEDCDDKVKKKVEIKPETISLGSGNTGCSLEDL
jgi:hypothetical protein